VQGHGRSSARERELRVTDDLAVGEGKERRFRPVARALHVRGQPLLERGHLGLAFARDVGVRLARDGIDAADEVRPFGPGGHLDALRSSDLGQFRPGQVEHEHRVSADLAKPAVLRPPQACRIGFANGAEKLGASARARPRPRGGEQCRTHAVAATLGPDIELETRDARGRMPAEHCDRDPGIVAFERRGEPLRVLGLPLPVEIRLD